MLPTYARTYAPTYAPNAHDQRFIEGYETVQVIKPPTAPRTYPPYEQPNEQIRINIHAEEMC